MNLENINTYLVIDGAGLPYTICIENKQNHWVITNVFSQCFNKLGKWEKEDFNNYEFILRCSYTSPQTAYDNYLKYSK